MVYVGMESDLRELFRLGLQSLLIAFVIPFGLLEAADDALDGHPIEATLVDSFAGLAEQPGVLRAVASALYGLPHTVIERAFIHPRRWRA